MFIVSDKIAFKLLIATRTQLAASDFRLFVCEKPQVYKVVPNQYVKKMYLK